MHVYECTRCGNPVRDGGHIVDGAVVCGRCFDGASGSVLPPSSFPPLMKRAAPSQSAAQTVGRWIEAYDSIHPSHGPALLDLLRNPSRPALLRVIRQSEYPRALVFVARKLAEMGYRELSGEAFDAASNIPYILICGKRHKIRGHSNLRMLAEDAIEYLGDHARARRYFQRAVGSEWNDEVGLLMLAADIDEVLDDRPEAVRLVERAMQLIRREPDSAGWMHAAEVWARFGNQRRARSCVDNQRSLAEHCGAWLNVATAEFEYMRDRRAAERAMARAESLAEDAMEWEDIAALWEDQFRDLASARRCRRRAR